MPPPWYGYLPKINSAIGLQDTMWYVWQTPIEVEARLSTCFRMRTAIPIALSSIWILHKIGCVGLVYGMIGRWRVSERKLSVFDTQSQLYFMSPLMTPTHLDSPCKNYLVIWRKSKILCVGFRVLPCTSKESRPCSFQTNSCLVYVPCVITTHVHNARAQKKLQRCKSCA